MLQTIKKILEELKIHAWKIRFYSMFIFMVIISLVLALEPIFFWKIIAELEKYYTNWFFDTRVIINTVIFWLIFIVISQIFRYIVLQELINKSSLIDYRESIKKYCKYTLSMTMWEYLGKKIWSIYKLIDRGTDYKFFFLYSLFEVYIFHIVWIIFIVIILFFIDVKMAFISLSLLPIMLFLWYYFSNITSVKQLKISKKWESIFEIVWNAMSNYWLFKILCLEFNFTKNIFKKSYDTYHEQISLNALWTFWEIYTSLLVALTRVLVLWFGIFYVKSWNISLAELFVIFNYIWWIYFPLGFLFRELRNSVRQLTETKRMYDELWNLKKELDLDKWEKIEKVIWNIEFKNINFSYNKDREIIKNLSLKIKSWEQVALVWSTWAWKSTLVNLLLRLWDSESWSIYLDARNIKEFSKRSLRSEVWVVSQDNSLFNLTVKENLLFANPKASKKDIDLALKKAEANFVLDFPNWINTIIWERWLKLSWWEKQRLSIARLFLKNPKILILDEATSALDNKTEKLVHKALDKLMKWRTSIIIAHRLSTIQNVDKIFMLESWELVESWTYNYLMKKKAKFYSLANPKHLIIN